MAKLRTSDTPKPKAPIEKVFVEKEVIKYVEVPVIQEKLEVRVVEKIVEVPVEKIVEIPVRVIETVEIEKIVEKEVKVPVKVIETVEIVKEKIVSDMTLINEEKQRTQTAKNKLKTTYIVIAVLVVTNILGWAL